jgi:hypothetical protein
MMPRDSKGEMRPADVIGNAIHVMRIATGRLREGSSGRIYFARAVRLVCGQRENG